MKSFSMFVVLAAFLALGTAPATAADSAADSSGVVAKIGSTNLTADQMQNDIGLKLFNAENQVYQTKKDWIDQTARNILFDKAAKEAHLSRSAWEAKNLAVPAPTEQQINDIIHKMVPAERIPTDPAQLAQLRQQATQYLDNQEKTQVQNDVYQKLTAKDPVQVLIAPPVRPNIQVSYTKDNPVKGPKDAAVTIVEFTDFQCPWCKRSQDNIRAVEQTYGNQIKLVSRQFPLTSIHPRAFPAAEAAFCAKEQGKYWQYREKLFDKQQLEDADFKRYAEELHLNSKKFGRCVASHKYDSLIQADMAAGEKFGVQGTPSFFVNGKQVSAQELEETVKAAVTSPKG